MKILDPISGNVVDLALKRLDARKNEDIDEWAEKLAKDVVESGNEYDRSVRMVTLDISDHPGMFGGRLKPKTMSFKYDPELSEKVTEAGRQALKDMLADNAIIFEGLYDETKFKEYCEMFGEDPEDWDVGC